MNTPVATDPTSSAQPLAQQRSSRPRWAMPAAAVAAILGLGAVGVSVLNGDDAAPTASEALVLTAGPDTSLAGGSCPVLEPAMLSINTVAYKGTVTSIDGSTVELTVDDAYVGTDAETAQLNAPEGMEALTGGVAWEVGGEYLVAAIDGSVQYCAQSGPVSPELQAIYDEAFGS